MESENEPGYDYFSYKEYKHRLFHDYNWRPLSPTESSCTSDVESDSSYRSVVKKSPFLTPPRRTQRNGSQTQWNRTIKQRNARQAHLYRKWLLPKTAFATLQKLTTPLKTEVTIYPSNQGVKAEVTINNATYEAVDRDKNAAKDKASELALRDLTISSGNLPMEYLAPFAVHKLLTEWKAPRFVKTETDTPMIEPSSSETPAQAEQRSKDKEVQIVQPSFLAIREACQQWKDRSLTELLASACGIATIIDHKSTFITRRPNQPRRIKTKADLPPDAYLYHPTVLFLEMRPQSKFVDLGWVFESGKANNVTGVRTDGRYFVGRGHSKKQARMAAAMEACKALFGVVFDRSVENDVNFETSFKGTNSF